MPSFASTQPPEADRAILRVLWERGPGRLSDICQWLRPQRKLVATTVTTTLGTMRRKDLLRRQQQRNRK